MADNANHNDVTTETVITLSLVYAPDSTTEPEPIWVSAVAMEQPSRIGYGDGLSSTA